MREVLMLVANNEVLKKIDPAKRTRCEVWTRVMGYHRPVSEFNLGKKGEHEERTHFEEPKNIC